MADDTVTRISLRDVEKDFNREAGALHRFELHRLQGFVLEVEDTHFHHDSAVLLPDYETGQAEQDRVTGLAVLQACYRHAEANPAQKALICGHTDRSGAPDYNLSLSQLRADNVLHALLGNRAEWVAIADKKHKVEDYQQILKWIARKRGWDCDPGAVDNTSGPATQAAMKRFQQSYNKELGGSISEDGAIGAQTWGAIFDVYMSELAKMMGVDAAGLATARTKLTFLKPAQKTVGCGENFPITPERAENYRSPIDRRVEILFFDPGEEPELACHPSPATCKAELCEIYDLKKYRFKPIPVKPIVTTVFIGARLHANFDRKEGGQNVDATDDNKRKPRILRPGAILLPNLDIDEDLATDRTRFKYTEVDAFDDKVNAGFDEEDLTSFEVVEPTPVVGNAVKIILKLDPKDAERVRIWEVPKGGKPKDGIVRIGPAVGNQHTVEDVSGGKPKPPPGWDHRFIVEARTLPGDPKLPAPTAKAPPPSGKLRAPIPDTSGGSQKAPVVNNSDTGKSIYDAEAARASGDVWMELIQEDNSGPNADLKDIGLFTIAPWIMTWNTLDCLRVYVAYLSARGPMNDPVLAKDARFENHCMVWDLQDACSKAGLGSAPDADTTLRLQTNKPKEIKSPNDVPFYVIDGPAANEDQWVQDEFEIGYCYAPHQWLHVTLHNMRNRGLANFVENEMAHPGLAVFNGIAGGGKSVNYGGNLEVSPPVTKATPKFDRVSGGNVAGPTCKEHDRPAPFGKIIVGDCTPRPCHADFHNFLQAQRVQPVLPVDTSWLLVGHVDEFMTFVRAKTANTFALLLAEVRCMTRILKEVNRVDKAATIHAGKYDIPGSIWLYDEELVEEWLGAALKIKSYSEKVELEKMDPIRERLKTGLDIADADILPIPTYFVPGDDTKPFGHEKNQTIARNPGMVNMLVVNEHLMIPRPFGPRLDPAKAKDALDAALKEVFKNAASVPATKLPSPTEHFVWARPGETLKQIAMYFARPAAADEAHAKDQRKKLIAKIKAKSTDVGSLDADYRKEVDDLMTAIRDDPLNKTAPTPIDTVAPAPDHKFTKWMRLHIPGNTVDVMEGYMKSILEPLGNTVHFIDDFECYHARSGEVHCGTNARRRPPEEHTGFTARWWNSGVYDPDYDTSYDPST